ncbi:LCP family protein [Yinghuangia sp. ASG 101]|uniref:LCP family protein n=1 Tax=Yinghuangia sp. ASG 101 TaxID=2896848 RepID=UPI001E40735D|nr:LCP family protein [Yinghuangia sp. ASG 101]UGQ09517.1 LCP family protein [Yinghuangia sp. ASG 101]
MAARGRTTRTPPPAPPRRRWGLALTGFLAVAILVTSGIGWAWVKYMDGKLHRVNPFSSSQSRPDTGAADDLNFLIVGTDSREGVPRKTLNQLHAGGESCDCTDTMMIVHLSAKRDKATVVSIPRDSYVALPAHKDKNTGKDMPETRGKINAAYTRGGPALTVAAVERATNIRIDHYIEVNFLAFVGVVDKLGGVEMCSPIPLKDPKSGLDLPAGTSHLDGVRSLQYVRSRYLPSDPTGDIGRTERQQKFMSQILARATSTGTLANPVKLQGVLDAVFSSITVDEGLSVKGLLDLGTKLKGLSNSGVTYAQIPLASMDHQVGGWGSTVLWDDAKARVLFDAIRDDRDLAEPSKPASPSASPAASEPPGPAAVEVAPSEVFVQVYNGTATTGLGARVHADLSAAGFPMNAAARDGSTLGISGIEQTLIRYDPRWNRSVQTVAAALPGSRLEPVEGLGRTIEVVVGSSYAGVTPVAAAATASQPPAPTPGAGSGAPSASPPIETTTGDKVVCD